MQKKTWTGTGRVSWEVGKTEEETLWGSQIGILEIWFGILFRVKIIVKKKFFLERILIFVVFY